MSNDNRVQITAVVWIAMAIALFGLFISGLGDAGLTVIHLMMATLILAVPSAITGLIWGWWGPGVAADEAQNEAQSEKVKRERIEEVLRNLSNAELVALKKRLQSNEINDDVLYAYLEEEEDVLTGRQ